MISWVTLVITGVCIVGAAWVLAAVGLRSYLLGGTADAPSALRHAVLNNGWVRPGALLICAGLAAGTDWPMRAGWGLICLGMLYGWWTERYGTLASARGASADVGARRTSLLSVPLRATTNRTRTRLRIWRQDAPWQTAAEWVIRAELLWLALLAPFFVFPSPASVWILFALPLLWGVRWLVHGRLLPRTPLDWPLVLLMVMTLVSIFVTYDLTLSLGKITPLLWGVGIYYAIVEWASDASRLRWALGAYIIAGVGLAIAGLLGTAWALKVPVLSSIAVHLPSILRNLPGEESGFNPNIVGGSLLFVVPLQVSLWGASWRTGGSKSKAWRHAAWRWGLLLALVVSGGALLLMQSRSALASFGVGAALLVWVGVRRARPVLLALVLAGVALLIVVGPQRVAGAVFGAADTQSSQLSQSSQSVQSRLETWTRAAHIIQDFAFTGTGMGTFGDLMPAMYPVEGLTPIDKITHAHNQFLQAALNLGVPGLIAFLALWMVAGVMVVTGFRYTTDAWTRAAIAGVGVGLLSHLLFGMTDAVVMVAKPGVFFWALLGLLVALWKQSRTTIDDKLRSDLPNGIN